MEGKIAQSSLETTKLKHAREVQAWAPTYLCFCVRQSFRLSVYAHTFTRQLIFCLDIVWFQVGIFEQHVRSPPVWPSWRQLRPFSLLTLPFRKYGGAPNFGDECNCHQQNLLPLHMF